MPESGYHAINVACEFTRYNVRSGWNRSSEAMDCRAASLPPAPSLGTAPQFRDRSVSQAWPCDPWAKDAACSELARRRRFPQSRSFLHAISALVPELASLQLRLEVEQDRDVRAATSPQAVPRFSSLSIVISPMGRCSSSRTKAAEILRSCSTDRASPAIVSG